MRINVGSDYQERYTFDQYKRISSTIRTIGSQTYTTSDTYNQASQPLQTAFGTYQYDSAGRVSSIAGAGGVGLGGITYNVAGQISADTLTSTGWYNGYPINSSTAETFGYDTNRMQLISQTAVTTNTNSQACVPPPCPPPPPGGTNLSLTYSYQASAGQMGVGTTAGNAGQLMAINNNSTIGGMAESASYTYDNYGRLVTSNQTTNGSSAQRRLAYDRWGNRSGLWNATSGGNQIQSVSLQTVSFPGTGSAPTNRITSVTSGSTLNYSYDTNGNVTNDGVHTYTYDSENRVMKVDNGAAVYAYDHQNRRYKKTVGSSVTHYVWEGGQVVGEYDGNTGALLVSYAYSGSRLFGKGGNSTQMYLSDRLSVRLTLSDAGVVVGRQATLPFGEDFAESGPQEKHHFTSYERDSESGMDYAMNRYYAAVIGNFDSADPLRTSIGGGCQKLDSHGSRTLRPQSWNKYSYTENDPVNKTDPSGLVTFDPSLGVCPAEYSTEQCIALGLIPGYQGSGSIWPWNCECGGTTECGMYNKLCKRARKQELNQAAIHYYCDAAPVACNRAPKSGAGSCTSNCIRKCLQDWEKSGACWFSGQQVGGDDLFVGCEALAHIDCYSSCAICAF